MTNPNNYSQPNPNFKLNQFPHTESDFNDITKILQQDTFQISPLLLRALQDKPFIRNDYSFQNKIQQLETLKQELIEYDKAVQLTLAIGWTEHTGDWDPFYKITLINGLEIFTESGYSNIEKITTQWVTFNNSDEDGEQKFLNIPLNDIQSLQILES